jgi:hypothetical protein
MKEIAAIYLEAARTEFPVTTIEKMEAEKSQLEFGKRAPRDQLKVRTVLLLFSPPGAMPVSA